MLTLTSHMAAVYYTLVQHALLTSMFAALVQLGQPIFSWLDSSTGNGALERLRQLDARHISTVAHDYEGEAALLLQFVAASPKSDLKEQLGRRQRETFQEFIDILEDGQRQGSIRHDLTRSLLHGISWALPRWRMWRCSEESTSS